ncbi:MULTISPECIES: hypothetical protein [unclassified Paenibacillus]|uniref:hypothetical protein n=1 Tax=unclassified Paenibacillus TaxID=185978 RepID=UPI0030D6FA60
MELIFKTADGHGLGVNNTVILDTSPFFVNALNHSHIIDVYIESNSYQLQSSQSQYLKNFSQVARSLNYAPYIYVRKSDWANPLRLWLLEELVHSVIQFNLKHSDTDFDGILLDIQPCELPASNEDLYFKNCLIQYINTLEQEKIRINTYNKNYNKNFKLKIVMPRQLTRFFVEEAALIYERLTNSVDQVIVVEYLQGKCKNE